MEQSPREDNMRWFQSTVKALYLDKRSFATGRPENEEILNGWPPWSLWSRWRGQGLGSVLNLWGFKKDIMVSLTRLFNPHISPIRCYYLHFTILFHFTNVETAAQRLYHLHKTDEGWSHFRKFYLTKASLASIYCTCLGLTFLSNEADMGSSCSILK